jgi:hypothetical protein
VGLVAMVLVLAASIVKRKPGVVFAAALAGMLVLPLLPSSYWERIASITDKDLDQTGSREARSRLLRESYDAFLAHPLTGVGAGQFKNYNPDGREEAWREAHNVVLQVAAELGVSGLMIFGGCCAGSTPAKAASERTARFPRWTHANANSSAPTPKRCPPRSQAGSSARCSRRWRITGRSTTCSRSQSCLVSICADGWERPGVSPGR